MKKIVVLIAVMVLGISARAVAGNDNFGGIDTDLITKVLGMAFLIYLIGNILLTFLKIILDYFLKNKMIEKGASESVVSQLLQTDTQSNRFTALKWAVILGSIGVGLLLVSQFPPFGIHSLVIMTFCVAAAFLAYYFLLKRAADQKV